MASRYMTLDRASRYMGIPVARVVSLVDQEIIDAIELKNKKLIVRQSADVWIVNQKPRAGVGQVLVTMDACNPKESPSSENRKNRSWTPEEDAFIIKHARSVDEVPAVSKALGRSLEGTKSRYYRLRRLQDMGENPAPVMVPDEVHGVHEDAPKGQEKAPGERVQMITHNQYQHTCPLCGGKVWVQVEVMGRVSWFCVGCRSAIPLGQMKLVSLDTITQWVQVEP